MRSCDKDNCKDENGNCLAQGSDGLTAQCVGPWVEDKYFYLERYLNASREARRKFSEKGNAVFIDLFAGPGKCIIREEKKEIDSGGLRALNRDEAPFNELFYFDIIRSNIESLEKRIEKNTNCHVELGDSNTLVNDLVKKLLKKYFRYHFAFIDPFGPDGLKFETIRELAKLDRMDLLIHFPIGAIKRNYKDWINKPNNILDQFLGTDSWHKEITGKDNIFKVLIDIYKKQLISVGYPEEGLKMIDEQNIYTEMSTVSVKNTRKVDLYVLILASKHPLAQQIWNSVIKTTPDGQRSFF